MDQNYQDYPEQDYTDGSLSGEELLFEEAEEDLTDDLEVDPDDKEVMQEELLPQRLDALLSTLADSCCARFYSTCSHGPEQLGDGVLCM